MKDCNQCGKCCINYGGGGLAATKEEIDLWEIFNPEIFKYVNNGEIWFDHQSGTKFKRCPFLEIAPKTEKHAQDVYTCSIYVDRPEDCRLYPSLVAEMVRDECEMIEAKDLLQPKQSQITLALLMDR